MRKVFFTCLIFYLMSNLFAAEDAIELARARGYQARIKGDFPAAIAGYQAVLELNPEDYDAKLALGRLFVLQKDFSTARKYFGLILAEDDTDLEAYRGLAEIAELTENYSEQIKFLEKIIRYAPEDISEEFLVNRLFELSAAYEHNQQYITAGKSYDEILKIDETYAEAWAQKAKLAYWLNRPFQAKRFYQAAIKWDPAHLPYQENLKKMEDLSKLHLSTKQNYIQETEAGLQTNSYWQIYKLAKRLNDLWETELAYNSLYSHRDNSGYKTAILDDFLQMKNRLYWQSDHYAETSVGYSILDRKFLNYQLHFSDYFYFSSLKISNHLSFNNELFEFWNEVSRKFINENIRISAFDFDLRLDYTIGQVDKNYVGTENELKRNDFLKYSLGLSHRIKQNLQLGLNYQFQDFAYESALYYTPIDRKLFGVNASYYWEYEKLYNYLSTNLQLADYQNLEQRYSLELGYDFSFFTASLSYSRFANIYYRSNSVNCLISGKF